MTAESSKSKNSKDIVSDAQSSDNTEPQSVIDAFFRQGGGEQAAQEQVDSGAQHCGLIAIVGKPNVGKSTLQNALVGQKISITSRKAQTTRHRILGVRTDGAYQFLFADTPGFQTRHSNALNRSLNKTVMASLQDVDLIVFVVEAGRFQPADAQVLELLPSKVPVLLVANKLDKVKPRERVLPWLEDMQQRHAFADLVPMSAKKPQDVARLLELCKAYLPQQEWWYDANQISDKSEHFFAAEVIREKLFRLTGDELPYSATVVLDKFEDNVTGASGKPITRIQATIVLDRASHKGMVIGAKGERLKRIGTEARQELERVWGHKVFLETWVKVKSGWSDDAAKVRSYGYE